ncbi:peptidoglycan/LPS O-acetylase OafA/YrhL [Chryseobacterium bernardetii]|jgi:peptidoglycan/LPS O-acetylase OafA/YrhL|uniref:Peptidoglycan/LPS O-acetylase OafA/YrhL n=2 Tax=Chryseobacterium TaxID=59732 RepID=A0A543ECD8_9FLAO|nr:MULTISPECIES: acyltransferase [Chryseobacterium]MDR6372569.1 peptidoglycan/LPS O-acetylase OafA/YrhL [Chryseobacterium vietnamense]MDR6442787.1 peptidoglycan/LPS O-acetylase OafA/YrhL [Chryseobacterium bernardetii]TQM19237.1 peptidoglycan/LPS O-acetylase OafA/YrhL [Chryseobacterium aquifrigidense]
MKLNNIQILRGIAALLVCCFHFRETINLPGLNLGNILFNKGSIGVPVFFIISGFIMAFTTQKINFSKDSFQQITLFYKRRLIRIVPLYYLLTFAVIIPGGGLLIYFHGAGLYELIHSLLFLPTQKEFPVLFLGWSLNFEMFFYLIFGLSLFFKEKRYYFIVGFFILTTILGYCIHFDSPYLKMVTHSLNLYFVVGILFALLLNKYTVPKKWAAIVSVTGITSFILVLLSIIPISNDWLKLAIISMFVFSFLTFDYIFHFEGNKFLIFLGDISYSLYLSHPFIEIVLKRFKVEGYLNIPFFLLKIALVIILASVLYYFVEKRVTHYLKIKLNA